MKVDISTATLGDVKAICELRTTCNAVDGIPECTYKEFCADKMQCTPDTWKLEVELNDGSQP